MEGTWLSERNLTQKADCLFQCQQLILVIQLKEFLKIWMRRVEVLSECDSTYHICNALHENLSRVEVISILILKVLHKPYHLL